MVKQKILIIYYLVLCVIMFLIMKPDQEISNIYRMGFLFLVISPTIVFPNYLPAALTLFLSVSITSFSQVLPTTEWYYLLLLPIFIFWGYRKKSLSFTRGSSIYLYYLVVSMLCFDVTNGILMCLVAVLLGYLIKTEDDVKFMFYAFMLVSLILSLQYILNFEYFAMGYRSDQGLERATWSNPNIYGLTIGCGGVLSGAYLMKHLRIERSFLAMLISILTIISVTIALIINASRGGLLFFSLSSNLNMIYKTLIVLICICGIYYLYSMGVLDVLLYRMADDTASTGGGRTTIWVNKFNAFTQNSNILQLLYGIGMTECISLAVPLSTHNDLVTSLIAFGFFGLLLFTIVISAPLRIGLKKDTILALGLSSFIFLESSLAEPFFRGNFLFIMFYLFVLKYFSIYYKKIK